MSAPITDQWSDKRVREVGEVYDLLVEKREGLAKVDIGAKLGLSTKVVGDRIHDIRRIMADDTINVVCDPVSPQQPWVYRLVGRLEEARGWLNNRTRDLETRIDTMHSVAKSLVTASDPRTLQGRRVRHIETALRHLIEDLELMTEGTLGRVDP